MMFSSFQTCFLVRLAISLLLRKPRNPIGCQGDLTFRALMLVRGLRSQHRSEQLLIETMASDKPAGRHVDSRDIKRNEILKILILLCLVSFKQVTRFY
jgi:hypothetical protein